MKMVRVYEPGDLLTSDQAADPRLIRLRIETDAAWRKANGSRAQYVFEYSAIKAWYTQRQNRPAVKAKAWNRSKSPSPVL